MKVQTAESHPQVLIQQAWGGTQEAAFLTNCQLIPLLLVRDPHSEKHQSKQESSPHCISDKTCSGGFCFKAVGVKRESLLESTLSNLNVLNTAGCPCHLPADHSETLPTTPPVHFLLSLMTIFPACRDRKESKCVGLFLPGLYHLGEICLQPKSDYVLRWFSSGLHTSRAHLYFH